MLPETRTRWDNDLSNGEVQYLINKGFTIGELAVMYEIPRNWIKDAVMYGDIKFKQKTGHKAPAKPVTAMWSDAKKLALAGSWTSPQKKEDKAMEQDDLFGTPAYKLHRTDTPVTSMEAAHAVDTSRLESIVYNVILESGENGIISDEVRNICRERHQINSYSSVTARFKALEEKNLIKREGDKRKGASGRSQYVMRAV